MKSVKQISSASVSVVLYKSKTLSNGEHPLMLRISKDGKRSYSALGISCSAKLWDAQKNLPKKQHPDKEYIETIITNKLADYRKQLLELKQEDKDFSSSSLIQAVNKPLRKVTVFNYIAELIERLKMGNKLGYANSHRDTLLSLKKYRKNKDFLFPEMDYKFLIDYETYLRSRGLRETTLAVYFRTLRSIYNKAIKERIVKEKEYPFKEFKITKFKTYTKKRAIKKVEIKKLEDLVVENEKLLLAKHVFLFSYYGFGINFIDIAKLKWSNISENDRIHYRRTKTGKPLQFKITQPIKEVLEYYRYGEVIPESYIFPILDIQRHITPTQIEHRVHRVNGEVNKLLKELGLLAGITMPLTTYVARHSSATVLKSNGLATSLISEAFGHSSELVTQIYLDSFENDDLDLASQKLL